MVLLPTGMIHETRYDRLIRAARAMRIDQQAFESSKPARPGGGEERKGQTSFDYTSQLAKTIMDFVGTRIRNIVPAAVYHMPGWLAQTIWDVMSMNGRVELQGGELTSIRRRFSPIPTIEDLIPMLVENHLPRIPLPKDTYLSPRDLATVVYDTLRQAEMVEAYAANELQMLAAAVRNIAYDARQGLFDQEGGGPQFERSLFNLVLIGAFDHPELRGRAALEPVMNRESMAILDKIKPRVTIAPVLDQMTLFGRGSIDGMFATGTLYTPKLPVCQGTIFEYEDGALAQNGVVRINMKEIATFDWDLDDQLLAVVDSESGVMAYSKGQPELRDAQVIQARVPIRLAYQPGFLDRPVLMDHPSVRYVYEHNEWRYRFHSEFRSRTVTTMSDNEFVLNRLMNPATRTHQGKVNIENMNLDKLTNAVLVRSPGEDEYVVAPVTGFPVTYFVSTGARGFERRDANIDMRSIFGYANYLSRPALAPNVHVPEDVLHTPRPAEVARISALLGLDDLAANASAHLLTVSYNAAWLNMVLGHAPDPTALLNMYANRRTGRA